VSDSNEISATSADAATHFSRRHALIGGTAVAAIAALPFRSFASPILASAPQQKRKQGEQVMETITVKDGTSIYFKDWGAGQPIVFAHGWPLSADAWDAQMLFFVQHGYRVVAHDRRGHGRSGQSAKGNDMDTYADDLAELFDKLDLKNAVLIGHSTGGGEVTRYLGRHGSKRVSKLVLIGAITPYMLQAETNPHGAPMSIFDGLRAGVAGNRAQFFKDVSMPFYGYNKPDAKISEGVREAFWQEGMQGSILAHYECVKAFSETDFREDLKTITIPTLVMHGDADQMVPLEISAPLTAKLLKNSTLKVYPGQPHGLCTTFAETVNADLLTFIKA
jgi:non-heme chloroperoxidase